MPRRLISSSRSEIRRMSAPELKQSIEASEGRTIMCQNCVCMDSLCEGTTNMEVSQAFGADMIFLNAYSMDETAYQPGCRAEEYAEGRGFEERMCRVGDIKKLVDVPVGVYLECGIGNDAATSTNPGLDMIRPDRVASEENLKKLRDEGADFVVLGGNPGTMTSFDAIIDATRRAKEVLKDEMLIFSGKWEDGVHQKVIGDPAYEGDFKAVIGRLIDAGADVICMPMPGSRQGVAVDEIRGLVTFIHMYKPGALAMLFLDGSVEGADEDTIRQCALWSKMTGADLHAIGDAGLSGMSAPENIYQMSLSIKGRRLTFRRLAASRR